MIGRSPKGRCRVGGILAILVVLGLAPLSAQAEVLTFDDITLGSDGTANVFGFYQESGSGFRVTGDFQARGPGANTALTPETSEGSGLITTSLAPFGGVSVSLLHEDGLPFTLVSIDLAREFQFNVPDVGVSYPRVTFTGTKASGGTVSQTFEVDQVGFFFRTFAFSDEFTDLLAVGWDQPAFGEPDPLNPGRILGLHQFDNIEVVPIPEPSSLALAGLGMGAVALALSRRRSAARRDD